MAISNIQVNATRETSSKLEMINIVTSQLKESPDRIKTLESNLVLALERNNKEVLPRNLRSININEHEWKTQETVIFHNPLIVNDINETILSKEKVTVKKVWAPTLPEIQQHAERMENTDSIVIESLTRSYSGKDVTGRVKCINVWYGR